TLVLALGQFGERSGVCRQRCVEVRCAHGRDRTPVGLGHRRMRAFGTAPLVARALGLGMATCVLGASRIAVWLRARYFSAWVAASTMSSWPPRFGGNAAAWSIKACAHWVSGRWMFPASSFGAR